MEKDIQALRDEILYDQVKGGKSLYRGLFVVFVISSAACIVMTVAALQKYGSELLIQLLGMDVSVIGAAYGSWLQYKDYANALDEIGDDPTGIDTNKYYSAKTAEMISVSRLTKKELRQQWIAYGILTFTLLVAGLFLLALWYFDARSEGLLIGIGCLMTGGGCILLLLTVRSFHVWRMMRRLEKLESMEPKQLAE